MTVKNAYVVFIYYYYYYIFLDCPIVSRHHLETLPNRPISGINDSLVAFARLGTASRTGTDQVGDPPPTLSYAPQKDLYWLTVNVPIILGTRDPSPEDSSTMAR